jgi:hypothetical protein
MLNWSVSSVENFSDVCFDSNEQIELRTEQLVFATMVVGMNQISEKNHLEFWYRLHLYESMFGSLIREADGEPCFFLLPDVKEHIGLFTNATIVPFGKWSKRVKETYLEAIQE